MTESTEEATKTDDGDAVSERDEKDRTAATARQPIVRFTGTIYDIASRGDLIRLGSWLV